MGQSEMEDGFGAFSVHRSAFTVQGWAFGVQGSGLGRSGFRVRGSGFGVGNYRMDESERDALPTQLFDHGFHEQHGCFSAAPTSRLIRDNLCNSWFLSASLPPPQFFTTECSEGTEGNGARLSR